MPAMPERLAEHVVTLKGDENALRELKSAIATEVSDAVFANGWEDDAERLLDDDISVEEIKELVNVIGGHDNDSDIMCLLIVQQAIEDCWA